MHLSDGEIRAYQDRALDARLSPRVTAHLESCQTCQARADALLNQKFQVEQRLSRLAPADDQPRLSPDGAQAAFTKRISIPQKEANNPMFKWTSRISRPAWVAMAVVALLAVTLAFPSVRAAANTFLGLFRVQQIRVVQVNPANLPDQLGASREFEAMLTTGVQTEEYGEPQEAADAAQAAALAGFPVRLPSDAEDPVELEVQPGGKIAFTVDVELARAVLEDIGRSDIQFPEELEGAQVNIEVPAGVMAMIGECDRSWEKTPEQGADPDEDYPVFGPDCTTLVQMPSPAVSAPPGLDLSQIGEVFLQVMGMSQEEAASLARNVDWTTTLVIPIPRYAVESRDIEVDGVTGTLLQRQAESPYAEYVIVWVKDGILYALSGQGGADEELVLANSLR